MEYYRIPLLSPVTYHLTGKFESLTEDWKHADLFLGDYELFVVTSGVLFLEYNNRQYRVEEGEMLLLPPVAPPNNRRKGYQSSACTFYWMHFGLENSIDTDDEDTYLIMMPERHRLHHPKRIVILMKQLQDAVRNDSNQRTLDYMTTTILCEVFDDISRIEQADNTSRKTQKQIYSDIVDYIKHNIHRKITVKQIADKFGYNEKYISHMFCQMSGITLKRFILQQKAEAANFFLTDTNLTIEEISTKLGYSDSHNFMRSYKNVTGFAPSEYRNAFSKRVLNH